MFEKHRAKVAAKAAERKHQELISQYESALKKWNAQLAVYSSYIEVANTFKGNDTNELMLKPGEALFYKVTSAGLVGERRSHGHYEGGSSGFSVPIGHIGHSSIRYRAGASRGHYVEGAAYETDVDVGNLYVTNKRVIFQGKRSTRECSFDKLVGKRYDNTNGTATFSVSNRQSPTTVRYGSSVAPWFVLRTELALAYYKGVVPQFRAGLEKLKNDLIAQKPAPPDQAGTPAES